MKNKNKLIQKVRDNFIIDPVPHNIFRGTPMFDLDHNLEIDLGGIHWDEVDIGFWNYHGIIQFSFREIFTPEGAYYFTPSIILGVIEDPDYFENFSCLLLPPQKKNLWWITYFGLFNENQKELIVDLVYYFDEYLKGRSKEGWYQYGRDFHEINDLFEIWSK